MQSCGLEHWHDLVASLTKFQAVHLWQHDYSGNTCDGRCSECRSDRAGIFEELHRRIFDERKRLRSLTRFTSENCSGKVSRPSAESLTPWYLVSREESSESCKVEMCARQCRLPRGPRVNRRPRSNVAKCFWLTKVRQPIPRSVTCETTCILYREKSSPR